MHKSPVMDVIVQGYLLGQYVPLHLFMITYNRICDLF